MLRVSEGVVYTSAAAGLIAMLLAFETPHHYLSVAWLAFAALLFEVGFRWREAEFRYQSYILGALGTGTGLILNALGGSDWPYVAAARHLRGHPLCRHAANRYAR